MYLVRSFFPCANVCAVDFVMCAPSSIKFRVIGFHYFCFFFFSSRRRHTRSDRDWSSDVCSSDLLSSQAGAYIGELNSGKTRGQVVREVIENQAFTQSLFNEGFVRMQYFGYLRRNQIGRASCRERV